MVKAPIPELMDRKKSGIMEWRYKNPILPRRIIPCQSKKEQCRRATMRPSRRAVKMVTEQGRSVKEVASELGICIDTLRSWLKRAGFQPSSLTRQNREDARLRELEAENRALRKRLAQKDEVIAVLKKSIGILSVP